jgi:hypothetical protein
MTGRFHIAIARPEDIIPRLGKGILHWRVGRSAAELAHAWWNAKGIPPKVRTVIARCAEWRGASIVVAFFEHQTELGTPGRPSQTDLLVLTESPKGRGIIAVEGKASEPFGPLVEEWLRDKPSKGKDRRLADLCRKLSLNKGQVLKLRYQLLHRTASALIEAKRFGCPNALVLVHHFAVQGSGPSESAEDFARFTRSLGAPVADRGAISKSVKLDATTLRFAWVDDRPAKPKSGLTSRDLVEALGWSSRLEQVDNELARYWRGRFEALSRAFGLPDKWQEDRQRTPRMLEPLAQHVLGIGFFARFLEYTSLPGETDVINKHSPPIKTAEAALRERLLDHATALLETFWPQVRAKSVSERVLDPLGPQPDADDYL